MKKQSKIEELERKLPKH